MSFLESLGDLVLSGVATGVNLDIRVGGRSFALEYYEALPSGELTVSLRDILKSAFTFNISTVPYIITQNPNLQQVAVIIDGGTTIDFTVIGGQVAGIDNMTFLQREFLNMSPQVKKSSIDYTEVLNVYTDQAGYVLKCKCHLQFASATVDFDLATLDAGMFIIPINFRSILYMLPEDSQLLAVDVFLDRPGFHGQRFEFDAPGISDDMFYFENCYGGLELIRFSGEKTDKRQYASSDARKDDELVDYDNEVSVSFEKNTGFLDSPVAKEFARDFMRSDNRYHVTGRTEIKRILLVDSKLESQDLALSSFSFEFRYAQDDLYALARTNLPLPTELGRGLAAVCQDNNVYLLWLAVDKLTSDLEDLRAHGNESIEAIQRQIDDLLLRIATIDDSAVSTTKVYSSSKVEQIKQSLANLFPYKTSNNNVRIDALLSLVNSTPKARQIIPMLACAGIINGWSSGGGSASLRTSYGPVACSSALNESGIRLTHNLGHTNYTVICTVFNEQQYADIATVEIRAISQNYFEYWINRPSGALADNRACCFAIFTFSDPRTY